MVPQPVAGGPDDAADPVGRAVAAAFRAEWGYVLATTARVTRDLDLAEECTADAFAVALERWRRDGIPRSPGGWLTTTARHRALDVVRRQRVLRTKLPLLVEPVSGDGDDPVAGPLDGLGEIPDDRLRLVFICCHPALAREAQVALTLRLVCGVGTAEIADAFLVSEPTMAARVTRAKKKIASARIPFRVPSPAELPERLDAVLTVVHLLFTTGHTASAGERLVRSDLVDRSVDLARTLTTLMPDEREAQGLLALILLTDARRATRLGADGRPILLEHQDRSRWDADLIGQGRSLVRDALRGGRPGRFTLQAAIAAVHAEAADWADTDWRQILGLYDLLLAAWPSPVVALNRAVAVAMVDGPAAGLAEVSRLEQEPVLAGYRYLHSTRAELLRRLDRDAEAVQAYRAALADTADGPERRFLLDRLATLGAHPSGPEAGVTGPG